MKKISIVENVNFGGALTIFAKREILFLFEWTIVPQNFSFHP